MKAATYGVSKGALLMFALEGMAGAYKEIKMMQDLQFLNNVGSLDDLQKRLLSGYKETCEQAVKAYMDARANGQDMDSPSSPFPCDGTYCPKQTGYDPSYYLAYEEGNKDKEWMLERDRKYLARLARGNALNEKERLEAQKLKEQQENPAAMTGIILPDVKILKNFSSTPEQLAAAVERLEEVRMNDENIQALGALFILGEDDEVTTPEQNLICAAQALGSASASSVKARELLKELKEKSDDLNTCGNVFLGCTTLCCICFLTLPLVWQCQKCGVCRKYSLAVEKAIQEAYVRIPVTDAKEEKADPVEKKEEKAKQVGRKEDLSLQMLNLSSAQERKKVPDALIRSIETLHDQKPVGGSSGQVEIFMVFDHAGDYGHLHWLLIGEMIGTNNTQRIYAANDIQDKFRRIGAEPYIAKGNLALTEANVSSWTDKVKNDFVNGVRLRGSQTGVISSITMSDTSLGDILCSRFVLSRDQLITRLGYVSDMLPASISSASPSHASSPTVSSSSLSVSLLQAEYGSGSSFATSSASSSSLATSSNSLWGQLTQAQAASSSVSSSSCVNPEAINVSVHIS